MGRVIDRLKELGHELPHAPAAVGAYVPALTTGRLVLTSGQLPFVLKELIFTGKLGHELHEEDGANAARICAINALAALQAEIGDLDRIVRIVINGASQLFLDVFGDAGKHTRIAVGANELPLNAAVELAVWVEVAG
jgi:enamine deaminase RidA (YjgF/YER057c/UK114 family)